MQLATIGPYPCFWLMLFVMSNFSFFTLYSWIFFTIHAFLFMFHYLSCLIFLSSCSINEFFFTVHAFLFMFPVIFFRIVHRFRIWCRFRHYLRQFSSWFLSVFFKCMSPLLHVLCCFSLSFAVMSSCSLCLIPQFLMFDFRSSSQIVCILFMFMSVFFLSFWCAFFCLLVSSSCIFWCAVTH